MFAPAAPFYNNSGECLTDLGFHCLLWAPTWSAWGLLCAGAQASKNPHLGPFCASFGQTARQKQLKLQMPGISFPGMQMAVSTRVDEGVLAAVTGCGCVRLDLNEGREHSRLGRRLTPLTPAVTRRRHGQPYGTKLNLATRTGAHT